MFSNWRHPHPELQGNAGHGVAWCVVQWCSACSNLCVVGRGGAHWCMSHSGHIVRVEALDSLVPEPSPHD